MLTPRMCWKQCRVGCYCQAVSRLTPQSEGPSIPSPSQTDHPGVPPGSTFLCLPSSQCREVLTCGGDFSGEEPVQAIKKKKDRCFAVSANSLFRLLARTPKTSLLAFVFCRYYLSCNGSFISIGLLSSNMSDL